MKKLFVLMLVLSITVISCERNDDVETPKTENHAKQAESTAPATYTAPPEEVDPKDITPPRR